MTTKVSDEPRSSRIALLLQELDEEADVMLSRWPVMQVRGTEFDTNPGDDDCEIPAADSSTGAPPPQPAAPKAQPPGKQQHRRDSKVAAGTGGPSLSFKQQQVAIRAAARKRAMMAEVITRIALFHHAVDFRKRVLALRDTIDRVFLRSVRIQKTLAKRRASLAAGASKNHDMWKPAGIELQYMHPLFASVPIDTLTEMSLMLEKKEYLAGDIVCTAGEAGAALWIVSTGELVQKTADPSAAKTYGPKTIFGDVFGTPLGYRETILCPTMAVAWKLDKKSVEDAMTRSDAPNEAKARFMTVLKEAYLAVLREAFPLAGSEKKVPILRNIDKAIMAKHWPRLNPIVLAKGDVLFKAATNASSVYVLVDGEVDRTLPASADGPEMTMTLCVNRHGAPRNGRYALLGDEPYILPEMHRYTCRVASDIAGFYSMPGAVFMDILLDDPKLYLQMRAELLVRRSKKMKLRSKEDALRQLPILSAFPPQRIQALVPHLTARCLERGATLCQPLQPLKELFLIVNGDVRDPRDKSTAPRLLPRGESPGSGGGGGPVDSLSSPTAGRGGRTLSVTTALFTSAKAATSQGITTALAGMPLAHGPRREFSVDADDFNPTLPAVIAQGFIHALAGDYEGLLCEKWTCGWETTSVVELWILPALAIRQELNDMPRPQMQAVLHSVRAREKEMLGLPEIRSGKLPAMSTLKPPQAPQLPPQQQQQQQPGRRVYGGVTAVGGLGTSEASTARRHVGKGGGDVTSSVMSSKSASSTGAGSETEGFSQLPSAETSQMSHSQSVGSRTKKPRRPTKTSSSHSGSVETSSTSATEGDEALPPPANVSKHPHAVQRQKTEVPHRAGGHPFASVSPRDGASGLRSPGRLSPGSPSALECHGGLDAEEGDGLLAMTEEARLRRQSVQRRDLEKVALRKLPIQQVIDLQIKARQVAFLRELREQRSWGPMPPTLHNSPSRRLAQLFSSPSATTTDRLGSPGRPAVEGHEIRPEAVLYYRGVDASQSARVIREVDERFQSSQHVSSGKHASSFRRSPCGQQRSKQVESVMQKLAESPAVCSGPPPLAAPRGPLPLAFTDDGPLELSPLNFGAAVAKSPLTSAGVASPRGLRWPSPPEKSTNIKHHKWNPTTSSLRQVSSKESAQSALKEPSRPEPPQNHEGQPAVAKRQRTFDENLKRVLLRMEQRSSFT